MSVEPYCNSTSWWWYDCLIFPLVYTIRQREKFTFGIAVVEDWPTWASLISLDMFHISINVHLKLSNYFLCDGRSSSLTLQADSIMTIWHNCWCKWGQERCLIYPRVLGTRSHEWVLELNGSKAFVFSIRSTIYIICFFTGFLAPLWAPSGHLIVYAIVVSLISFFPAQCKICFVSSFTLSNCVYR